MTKYKVGDVLEFTPNGDRYTITGVDISADNYYTNLPPSTKVILAISSVDSNQDWVLVSALAFAIPNFKLPEGFALKLKIQDTDRCVCELQALLAFGCKCGQIEREGGGVT